MSDLCRKQIINAVGKLGKKDDGRYREEILVMRSSSSGSRAGEEIWTSM